jgi:hypothetical protein
MKLLLPFAFFFVYSIAFSQTLTQSISGKVNDAWTNRPVALAHVSIFNKDQLVKGTTTDSSGYFFIAEAEPGRYRLVVSYTGYQPHEQELLIISGKSQRLEIPLLESKQMLEEIVVVPPSVASSQTISIPIEKALRVPANFFDPVRMLTSYPGVAAANDQSNAIMVKGYSPNAMMWRLQGLDILNPNHLANAGTFSDKPTANGGGVNVLSAQLLDRSDFYTGTFRAPYGNALSGVMDMSLRPGNTNKVQYTAQASLIGLDVAAEGPLDKKKNRSSFLANYRYSTVGLLSQMGLDFGGERISFQDLSFHLTLSGKQGANLSVFGFAGLSENRFTRKDESEWEEEKDRYNIDFTGNVYGAGFVQQFKPGWLAMSAGASFSAQDQKRKSQGAQVPYPNVFRESFSSEQQLVSAFVKGIHKFSSSGMIESGLRLNYWKHDLDVESVNQLYINPFTPNVRGLVDGLLWQPYITGTYSSGQFQAEAGIRYMQFTYNQSSSLEPRFRLSRLWNNNTLTFAYGLTSQLQQAQTYLAPSSNGLGFTKSSQFSLEWKKQLPKELMVHSSVYYHHLFDVPVQFNNEWYSVLNQWDDYPQDVLVNAGEGRNYGIETWVDKKFYGDVYFMVSGSWYQSQFKAEGNFHDTRFNGKFTGSLLGGKEWRESNKVFGVHARMLFNGGLRQAPVDPFTSRLVGTTIFDTSRGYTVAFPNYFRSDLRISWRKDKPGYTRTLSIDIQNLTGYKNVGSVYYDTFLQAVKKRYQVGIIPILAYRVDF